MSSMLEQAIIDAEQLKETAQRTAEEGIVEKYQDEIKEAIEKILEQDDLGLTEEELPEETQEVQDLIEDLPPAQTSDMEEVVEIDLNKLEEMMAQEIAEGETLDVSEMPVREEVAEEIAETTEVELDESLEDLLGEENEIEINEENLAALVAEMLGEDTDVDLGMDDTGTEAQRTAAENPSTPVNVQTEVEELEEETEVELEEEEAGKRDPRDNMGGGHGEYKIAQEKPNFPYRESKELQKENKSLLREQKLTNKKVHMLQEKVDKYGTVINTLKDKLNESNLTNAKLLYQNRILNSVSLNERQKDKIVEAISNATTVEEAKIIFETLQSAVGVSKRKHKRPESLNEVVTRSSSAFIPRKEVKPSSDAFSERMKRLAGLK
jgi:hypothetical protein